MSPVSKLKINVFYPFTTNIIQNALIEICFLNFIRIQYKDKGASPFFFNINQFSSTLDLKKDQSTIKILRYEGLKNKFIYYGGKPDVVLIGPDISLRGLPFGSAIRHIFISKSQLLESKKSYLNKKSSYVLFIPDGSLDKIAVQLKEIKSKSNVNGVTLLTDFNDTRFVPMLIKENIQFFCFYEVNSVIRLAKNSRFILSSSLVAEYLSGVSRRTLGHPDNFKEMV